MAQVGVCTDPSCRFAHTESQLRRPAKKWKMCNFHHTGRCKNGANCHFAHSSEEQQHACSGTYELQQGQQHEPLLQVPQPAILGDQGAALALFRQGQTPSSDGRAASSECGVKNVIIGGRDSTGTQPPKLEALNESSGNKEGEHHRQQHCWEASSECLTAHSTVDSVASDGVSNVLNETNWADASSWESGSEKDWIAASSHIATTITSCEAVAAGNCSQQVPTWQMMTLGPWIEREEQKALLSMEDRCPEDSAPEHDLMGCSTFASPPTLVPFVDDSTGEMKQEQQFLWLPPTTSIATSSGHVMPVQGYDDRLILLVVPSMPLESEKVYTD